jgi:hypothetical protein
MEARQRQQDAINAINQAQGEQLEDASTAQNEGQDDDNSDKVGTTESPTKSLSPSDDNSPTEPGTRKESCSESERTDRKPPAKTTIRDKRVRIASPEAGTGNFAGGISTASELDVFPAFYRVVQDAGAAVYNDGHAISFVTRVVPFGVVVLGQEMAWRNCDGESQMMVRIPDGWVSDEQLERIVAVPLHYG